MAEELNLHFSSVFTKEDTSALPVQKQSSMDLMGNGWGS